MRLLDGRRRGRGVAGLAATGLALAAMLTGQMLSCAPGPGPTTPQQTGAGPVVDVELPRAADHRREPTVRVRIERLASELRVDAGDAVLVSPGGGAARRFAVPVRVRVEDRHFHLTDGHGNGYRWRTPRLALEAADGGPLGIGERRYPQRLVLVGMADQSGRMERFDVVNHVSMETYLPGVLERELFPDWDLEAFKAQAIAARSYAMFEMALRSESHFDLHATVASQVYGGASEHRTAREAVEQTRGEALVHEGRVVPGFYSSTCGGITQPGTVAFDRWAVLLEGFEPLAGGVSCDACEPATWYRWGPIDRDADELARRVAGWGRQRGHAVGELSGGIAELAVDSRLPGGRPRSFRLVDGAGRSYGLTPEQLRHASNFGSGVRGEMLIRSSHFATRLEGGRVRFHDGRGFGHGAGMCQWGAQGLAERNYTGRRIVEHYYRGASVRRLY